MTLFHHVAGADTQYIAQFHTRQGDRAAGLSWEMRDGRPREVLVFQSTRGVVEDGVEPTADEGQWLVYQGTETHARLTDSIGSDDVVYYYPDSIAYYYSVFARGDDGHWYLQLTERAKPRSVGHWYRPDGKHSGGLRESGDPEIDAELANLSSR